MAPVDSRAEVRYTDEAGLARALDGADVLFLYDFLSGAVPAAWHAADSLQWLHIAAAGVDPVMFPEARDSDVTITNSRGVFDGAIAEYVLAQILSFAKDLPGSLRLQQSHTWKHRESERIAGRTALIVGTGPIGRAVARLLRAAGMTVRGSGRRGRESDPDFGVVLPADDLPAQLADADYVVAVAPLTEQTRHMFCAETFAAMKPGHGSSTSAAASSSAPTTWSRRCGRGRLPAPHSTCSTPNRCRRTTLCGTCRMSRSRHTIRVISPGGAMRWLPCSPTTSNDGSRGTSRTS